MVRTTPLALLLLLACAGQTDPPASAPAADTADRCRVVGGGLSRDHIGWLGQESFESERDVSEQFRSLLAEVRAGREVIPESASRYVYLLVPGLMSTYNPTYMNANIQALADRGLEAEKVELDAERSIEFNAQLLREMILKTTEEGGQVVLMGHSKGGLEGAAALALFPELRPLVRVLVTIQSPYAGAVLATDIDACPKLADLLANLMVGLGDEPEAVTDLSYASRRAFVTAHPYPQEVPALCLVSSRSDWRSILVGPATYLRRSYGLESDGLVVPADGVIPGARWVELDDMDHAETVLTGVKGFAHYHPGELTQVLVALALAD